MIAETGAVAGKTRRALDSTVLDDAVARQDTVTQLIAAIRRVGREVPGAAEADRRRCSRAHDYTDPGKPRIAWDDAAARDELVSALVGDALGAAGRLDVQAPAGAQGRRGGGVAGVGRRAGRRTGRGLRWHRRPVADRPPGRPGPGDLDRRPRGPARAQDRHRRQDGFKAHVVVEPDTGITTDCALTKASGRGQPRRASVGLRLLERDATGRCEVLGDSAYGTGDARAALDRGRAHRGDQAVADAAGGARRVHRRRLHRRRGGRHRRPARPG